jgi:hypothetical protein
MQLLLCFLSSITEQSPALKEEAPFTTCSVELDGKSSRQTCVYKNKIKRKNLQREKILQTSKISK